MRFKTKERKEAIKGFRQLPLEQRLTQRLYEVTIEGKKAMDAMMQEMGRLLVETILYVEREELTGPDYHPYDSQVKKWASEPGSGFLGHQKIRIERPRIRGPEGEIKLKSYQQMRTPGSF